jgi:hypothetical protein
MKSLYFLLLFPVIAFCQTPTPNNVLEYLNKAKEVYPSIKLSSTCETIKDGYKLIYDDKSYSLVIDNDNVITINSVEPNVGDVTEKIYNINNVFTKFRTTRLNGKYSLVLHKGKQQIYMANSPK